MLRVTHLRILRPPDCEVITKTTDGGQEGDHHDQDRDPRGDSRVRDPLVRCVRRGAVGCPWYKEIL